MSGGPLGIESETISNEVYDWIDQANVPGIGIAVVSSSEISYLDGIGARDRKSNAPVTEDTVFGIGSCTKSVTALAVLQLVEQGEIELSDPVSSYLPHLDEVPGDPITIEELLSHATGMPSDGYLSGLLTQLTGRGDNQATPPVSSDTDLRSHIAQFADERVTDDEWQFYYNTGFTLLGKVIEACTQSSYAEYVTENILDPVGMSRSSFSRDAFEAKENRITPYRLEDGKLLSDRLAFDDLLYAAGGLCSSPADMAAYLQLLMNTGATATEQLVSEALVTEMVTGKTEWSETLDGTTRKYGYGVFTQPFLQDTLVSHGGMMETTTAWFGYLEEADSGVFLTANTTPERPLKTLGKSLLALTQETDPDTVVPRRMLDRKIDPLTGTYETTRGAMSATVTRSNGGVRVTADNPGWNQDCVATPTSLDPETHQFQTVQADGSVAPVSFNINDGNPILRIGRWQLHQQTTADN